MCPFLIELKFFNTPDRAKHGQTWQTPAEDRNRTSPFPYGGMRFEFRAVGSSQNVSVVNTVLGAIVADQFKAMADRVEGGETAAAVAQNLLKQHMKVVFNGNGYAEEWPVEAEAKGLFVIPSNVDAMCCLSAPKNVEMFEGIKVSTSFPAFLCK